MEISVINQTSEKNWNRYKKDFETIAAKTKELLQVEQEMIASIIFVTPKEIHEINRTYRNIDRPTDVISFALMDSEDDYEMMEDTKELGDIFININAIREQAEAYGHSLRREVCFLFTHGLLHLLGYDHETKADESIMFSLQDEILNDIVPKKIKE